MKSGNRSSETRNAAAKIATSDVDQGSAAAIRMAKISDVADHAARSRHSRGNNAPTDSVAAALTPWLRARG
jgi:hypothetical protein